MPAVIEHVSYAAPSFTFNHDCELEDIDLSMLLGGTRLMLAHGTAPRQV